METLKTKLSEQIWICYCSYFSKFITAIVIFYFQGIMWGLACRVSVYDGVTIAYVKEENYSSPTSATLTSTTVNRYPSELAIMGIISFCLTLINIFCIFAAAIIVLKVSLIIFWDVTHCGLVDILVDKQHFWVTCHLHVQRLSTVKVKTSSSDILAPIYQCMQCHIPEITVPFMLPRTPDVKSHVMHSRAGRVAVNHNISLKA